MNKVIIIDQVDDIQRIDDTIMYTINTDINNSFILIGRAPLITYNISNMAELHIENGKIIFEYMFDEPMAK